MVTANVGGPGAGPRWRAAAASTGPLTARDAPRSPRSEAPFLSPFSYLASTSVAPHVSRAPPVPRAAVPHPSEAPLVPRAAGPHPSAHTRRAQNGCPTPHPEHGPCPKWVPETPPRAPAVLAAPAQHPREARAVLRVAPDASRALSVRGSPALLGAVRATLPPDGDPRRRGLAHDVRERHDRIPCRARRAAGS